MGNKICVNREEMLRTIIDWYTFQLKIGQIQWKYYKIFIRYIHSVPYQSLYPYFIISKIELDKNKNK